ncbi:hypothetical protein HYU18_00690 [Candidatus Woesearchaeota archaeon]|nr:hypothetical protein [Candidatus Woesearchaeota archaeon]
MERRKEGNEFPAGEEADAASLSARLARANGIQEIFELVKEAVWKAIRVEQAGLMVGLAELGIGQDSVLGAFYSPEANTIVMNRTIVDGLVRLGNQKLHNSYCFYILLHEYLHSCGFYDEVENRQIVAALAANEFGLGHDVTKLATINDAMRKVVRISAIASRRGLLPSPEGIEFVSGIDRSNTNYIM